MSTYNRSMENRGGGGGVLLLLAVMVIFFGLIFLGIQSIDTERSRSTNDVQDYDPKVDELELESNSVRAEELKVYTNTSHAEKHGSEALAIRDCITNQGADAEYELKSAPTKKVQVCILPNGDFGLWFYKGGKQGDWHEITAFIKNSVTSWEELEVYLESTGYLIP